MYKKYLTLSLSEEREVPVCLMKFDESCSRIEVRLIDDEAVDLVGCRIKVSGNQLDGKSIFRTCEILTEKNGRVSLDLVNHFSSFDVRLPCELKVYGPDEMLIGNARFYLVVFNPVKEGVREGCSTDSKVISLSPKVRMIAHRGLSSLAPENTLPAYYLAGQYGYYGAECDIHETKDHHFILMHDDSLNRMTNGQGKPEDYTLEELKRLVVNAGSHIEDYPHLKIPTLEEFLQVCKVQGIVPVIELKKIKPESVVRFLDVLRSWGDVRYAMIITFHKEVATEVRNHDEAVNIQWLADLTHENIDYCARYHMGIDCPHKKASKEMIDYAHLYGVLVNAWTVDNGAELQSLIEMGIDFVSTNVLLFNQEIKDSGKVKSYLFNDKLNYVSCIHESINNKDGNTWEWHEAGQILELRGNADTKKMIQIKLPSLNVGDVVSISFYYRYISGDEIKAGLLYVNEGHEPKLERFISTKTVNDWNYAQCQFITTHRVSGSKTYYQALIGAWENQEAHFMIRDVRIKIEYM